MLTAFHPKTGKLLQWKKSYFLLRQDGEKHEYRLNIMRRFVPRQYFEEPYSDGGFDIAICVLDISPQLKREILKARAYKWPTIARCYELQKGAKIRIAGYPAEYHHELYEMKGTVGEHITESDKTNIISKTTLYVGEWRKASSSRQRKLQIE